MVLEYNSSKPFAQHNGFGVKNIELVGTCINETINMFEKNSVHKPINIYRQLLKHSIICECVFFSNIH